MVAYSGYSSVGQTYYLDAFDQIGASQYTLRYILALIQTTQAFTQLCHMLQRCGKLFLLQR